MVVLCAVDATEDDVKALVAEMEMLSSIGPHENIVSMLRVCTVGSEYCACMVTMFCTYCTYESLALSAWKPIALILFSEVLSILYSVRY